MDEHTLGATTTEIYCENRCSKYSLTEEYPSSCEECIGEPIIQSAKDYFYEVIAEEIQKQDLSLERLDKKSLEKILRDKRLIF